MWRFPSSGYALRGMTFLLFLFPLEIPIVGLRPSGNDVWGVRAVRMGNDVGVGKLSGKRKFPIYYIGSAENDIFLTFSQKKLSFAF